MKSNSTRSEKAQDDNDDKTIVRIARIATIGVICVWALSFLFFLFIDDWDKRGQFGDMFGAVNALFSGLAFAGLIITLILQKRELGLQREELEATRLELARQSKEFDEQNKIMRVQRFESGLYNMLTLFQHIVNDLLYDSSLEKYGHPDRQGRQDYEVHGRDIFRFAFEQRHHYYTDIDIGKKHTVEGMKGVLQRLGIKYYNEFTTPSYFDHYFRYLYRLLKYIDNTQDLLTDSERYKYAGDVRGTLSRYELVWLYYNILANHNFKEFKHLVEKYSLLKNLNTSFLALSNDNEENARRLNKLSPESIGFSGSDYEFWLSGDDNNPAAFYVGAFYNAEDLKKGLDKVKYFQDIIRRCSE